MWCVVERSVSFHFHFRHDPETKQINMMKHLYLHFGFELYHSNEVYVLSVRVCVIWEHVRWKWMGVTGWVLTYAPLMSLSLIVLIESKFELFSCNTKNFNWINENYNWTNKYPRNKMKHHAMFLIGIFRFCFILIRIFLSFAFFVCFCLMRKYIWYVQF